MTSDLYARTQADGADNIAPTPMQGQQAWQYALSDNFFSPEEQTAVMRQQIEPHRAQIESKLSEIGYPPAYLTKYPDIEQSLYSGQQTRLLNVIIAPDTQLTGALRIVMTEHGPDIRITPKQPTLNIPNEIGGIHLTKADQQQLKQEGALPRPFLIAEQGEYVPTFLRVNERTNTVELWQLRPEQLPTKLMGIDLTKDQQVQLVHGHPVRLTGLLDKQGEPFNATVSVSATKQSLEFADLSRLDVAIKPAQEFKQQLAQNNEGAKTDLTVAQERATGLPGITHQQSESIKQLLEQEPSQQEQTLKMRR